MQIKLVVKRNGLYCLYPSLISRTVSVDVKHHVYLLFVILQALFKNWLKHNFVLTAYVWEAAPCSILPTADENAVTESAVTTVSSNLFQSATVRLTKSQLLHCSVLLSGILKPQEFRISCLAMGVVRIAILEGGRAYSSSISICWHQGVQSLETSLVSS